MRNNFKKSIKNYLKEISNNLPRNYPNKKNLLHTLKQSIDSFIEEYPSVKWEDIVNHFGTSEELAASYLEDLSDTDLATSYQTRYRSILISTIICLVALIFLIIGIYSFHLWEKTHDFIIDETLYVYDGTEIWSEWDTEIQNEEY